MTTKWTPGEKAVASEQVDAMANATPHKTFTGALVLVAENLALQRNTLRDALELASEELEEIVEWARIEEAPLREQEIKSIVAKRDLARKVLAKCK